MERIRNVVDPREACVASAPSFTEGLRGDQGGATTRADGAVTEDDGVLPDGVTLFDDQYPGVANLDPDLLQALREAATDARDDGIEFFVNSGWRSPEYQGQLFREAVSKYGSEEEAARWVATVDKSAHVSGDAIDIGPSMPPRGCRSMAPSMGRARPTATSPGTTKCAPGRSVVVALRCMPTPREDRRMSSDRSFPPILSSPG